MWPAKPSPDELLARRVEDGWHPVPSRLKEGAVILGHAACLARWEK
ncbi:MAG TPA: hypothetical protein VKA46_32765 [Gemmataceae bacterium]|nr:hypothetical protein [Gemmataceae bacterium]